ILAAILFPVFAQAKLAAKKTKALAQMRQLSISVMMYAADYDDHFIPASMREITGTVDPIIWPQGLMPYIKNEQMLVAVDADGAAAQNWGTRRTQSIGYNDATGVDPNTTAVPGNAPPGTEGFPSAANFSAAEEVARVGLFTVTPNGPAGDTTSKHRG